MFRPRSGLGLRIAGLACALGGAVAIAGCANRDSGPPHAAPPHAPTAPPAPVDAAIAAGPADAAPTDPRVIAGAAVWGKYCALCHGPQARGYLADHAPSLVTSTFLATASDDFLRAGIGRGRPGTSMAGYARAVGGPLDDAHIDLLIAFLRNGAPAPAPLPTTPVTGDLARGAVVYKEKCLECHGTPQVRGEEVHLANPVFLQTASDAFLRQAIAFGRPDTKMVGFAGTLTESDIDATVALLRSWARPTTKPDVPPAVVATPGGPDPTAPVPGKIVMNPKGKAPAFQLREERFVPVAQVKKALDQKRKIVIVDARPPSDWIRMHIPGAVSVPYYDLSGIDLLPTDGTWIVAYCACPHHASGVVVDELRKRGITTSAVLDEGILFWQQQGFPVIAADGTKPPPPKTIAPTRIGPDLKGQSKALGPSKPLPVPAPKPKPAPPAPAAPAPAAPAPAATPTP